ICDAVIAAGAAGAAARPPMTSAPARAVAAASLFLSALMGRGPIGAPSTSAASFLGAARVRAAVAARVATAGADPPPAAAGALARVLPRVEEGRLTGWRRLGGLGGRGRLAVRPPTGGIALGHPCLDLGREDPSLLLLLGREEPLAEPAEDVVNDRLR